MRGQSRCSMDASLVCSGNSHVAEVESLHLDCLILRQNSHSLSRDDGKVFSWTVPSSSSSALHHVPDSGESRDEGREVSLWVEALLLIERGVIVRVRQNIAGLGLNAIVLAHLAFAGIHDIDDIRDGDGCLCDVCGQDDALQASFCRREDSLLFRNRDGRVQNVNLVSVEVDIKQGLLAI